MEHVNVQEFRRALEGLRVSHASGVSMYREQIERAIRGGHDTAALSWNEIYSRHVHKLDVLVEIINMLDQHTTEITARPALAENLFGFVNDRVVSMLRLTNDWPSSRGRTEVRTSAMAILAFYCATVLEFDVWLQKLPDDANVDDWDEDTVYRILGHFRAKFGHLVDESLGYRHIGSDYE